MVVSLSRCRSPTPQDGSAASDDGSGSDFILDMSAGTDGRIISVGVTYGSYAATNLGGSDYVAVMLDAGALATQSPTNPPVTTAPQGSPFAPIPSPSTAVLPNTLPSPSPALSDSTLLLAGVISSVVAGIALVMIACFVRKRRAASKTHAGTIAPIPAVAVDKGNIAPPLEADAYPRLPLYSDMFGPAANETERREGTDHAIPVGSNGVRPPPSEATVGGAMRGGARGVNGGGAVGGVRVAITQGDTEPNTHAGNNGRGRDRGRDGAIVEEDAGRTLRARNDGGGGGAVPFGQGDDAWNTHAVVRDGGGVGVDRRDAVDGSAERDLTVTTSTLNISTGELDDIVPAYERGGVASRAPVADKPYQSFGDIVDSSSTGRRASSDGLGLGHAVGDAAMELALNCHVPGVSEAAAIVSILVNLVTNNRDTKSGNDASFRRCRSIVLMLQRAAKVLGQASQRCAAYDAVPRFARLYPLKSSLMRCLHIFAVFDCQYAYFITIRFRFATD